MNRTEQVLDLSGQAPPRQAAPRQASAKGWAERMFKLEAHGTTVRTEIVAGLTTFLTMAYIIFVNPSILGDAGMPKDAVFVATCLIAALGTGIMALYANYPIALAPGMGLNAYFAYVVVLQMGFTWQAALGAVFVSGCLFLLVTVFKLRELIIKGIPHSIRIAITVGIGLFLAIIALKSAGIVAPSKATYVTLGDLHTPEVVLSTLGFFLIVVLDRLKVPGAILIGIISVTVLSFFFGGNTFHGIFAAPPSIAPTFLQLDIKSALSGGILNVILVFFLVELFDATGTLMGVARRAGLWCRARWTGSTRRCWPTAARSSRARCWVPPARPLMSRALRACRPAAARVLRRSRWRCCSSRRWSFRHWPAPCRPMPPHPPCSSWPV